MRIVSFFLQAEDGIRDADVTGVQTCALPICRTSSWPSCCPLRGTRRPRRSPAHKRGWCTVAAAGANEIGRALCRERVLLLVMEVSVQVNLKIWSFLHVMSNHYI